ncbi:MAG TPA: hypothetical protein VJ721_03830 [Chthoniobacterales bacterium]|nr:hypothetical protein [Chthoniobacterales bacterium]
MSLLLAPIELSGSEKLEMLRRLDRFRKWQSLNEKRYCLACGQIIDGHRIHVVGGTRGSGPLRLICPTARCHSIAMDWVFPTDQVLGRLALLENEDALVQPKTIVNAREKFSEQLRKLATQLWPAA